MFVWCEIVIIYKAKAMTILCMWLC